MKKKKYFSNLTYKFDYNILKQSLKIILENDHSLSVAKFIWFYYRNAHIMSIEHLADVFSSLYDYRFYSLFFHWSWQVRNIYYYFILFVVGFRIKTTNYSLKEEPSYIRRGIGETKEVANYPEMVNI